MLSRRVFGALLLGLALAALPPGNALAQDKPEPFVRHFSAEQMGEVSAADILAAIEQGRDINIEYAVITGPLDIAQIRLPTEMGPDGRQRKVVKGEISIKSSKFLDVVAFGEAHFSSYAVFEGAQFSGNASFRQAQFSGYASFREAQFSGYTDFVQAQFSGNIDFRLAQFSGDAYFPQAQFSGGASFRQAQFSRDANFVQAQFSRDAHFPQAQFSGDASFRLAQFSGDANFPQAQFSGGASFPQAQFSGNASFRLAQFSGDADFVQTQFSRDADFVQAQLQGPVDFNRTDFSRMHIRWAQLEGKLAYNDWLFAALVRNFESLGQFEDADSAYLSYRVAKRNRETPFPHPAWLFEFFILDLTCGYGVRPFRTLGVAIFLILAFAIAYYPIGAIRQLVPSQLGAIRSRRRRMVDALYFSFTSFTTVGYGDWYPTEQPLFRIWRLDIGSVRTLAMMQGLLGWLVLALFLVTLGKVWIR